MVFCLCSLTPNFISVKSFRYIALWDNAKILKRIWHDGSVCSLGNAKTGQCFIYCWKYRHYRYDRDVVSILSPAFSDMWLYRNLNMLPHTPLELTAIIRILIHIYWTGINIGKYVVSLHIWLLHQFSFTGSGIWKLIFKSSDPISIFVSTYEIEHLLYFGKRVSYCRNLQSLLFLCNI